MNAQKVRNTLKANSRFSIFSGLIMTLLSGTVADWLGIEPTWIIIAVGVGLLIFAASVYHTATREPLPEGQVKFIIVQDWLWVAGSTIILVLNPFGFSASGLWITGIVALIVAAFAVGQQRWLNAEDY